MSKSTLPTNFQDDILNASMGGKRRYRLINNTDETVSLEDVTTYDQVGSNFGAGQINQTNAAINEAADKSKIIDDLETISAVTEEGYIAGALTVGELINNLAECRLIPEGSGADTKYYIQRGADAASKKLLGDSTFITVAMTGETDTSSGRALCIYSDTGRTESEFIYQYAFILNDGGTRDLFDLGVLTIKCTDLSYGVWTITTIKPLEYINAYNENSSKEELNVGESLTWTTRAGCAYVFYL